MEDEVGVDGALELAALCAAEKLRADDAGDERNGDSRLTLLPSIALANTGR